jgi:Ca2+-binding EF-hand superfamily protein
LTILSELAPAFVTSTGLGDYPRPGFEFQTETCRQMIAMLDKDGDMQLGFPEFQQLYAALDAWKLAFQRYDRDMSGTVEHGELNEIIL